MFHLPKATLRLKEAPVVLCVQLIIMLKAQTACSALLGLLPLQAVHQVQTVPHALLATFRKVLDEKLVKPKLIPLLLGLHPVRIGPIPITRLL